MLSHLKTHLRQFNPQRPFHKVFQEQTVARKKFFFCQNLAKLNNVYKNALSVKTILLLAFYLLHFTFSASAQNFLWGRSGGSSDPSGGFDDEKVRDVATDKNGNVYVLALAHRTNRNVAGQPVDNYGYTDMVLSSFRPDGSLRWVKVIGGGNEDWPRALQTDAKDGVYVAGYCDLTNGDGLISGDAVVPQTFKQVIVVKYDTGGVFQWYKMPEADTVGIHANNGIVSMDVDDNGTAYLLCSLGEGLFGNSLSVTTPGLYILKYDAAGNFSYINPNVTAEMEALSTMFMKVDDASGRLYISGARHSISSAVTIAGNPVVNSMYIASLNLDGSFNWKRENNIMSGGFSGRAVTDTKGDIYLCGVISAATTWGNPAVNFNGFIATQGGGSVTPFIVKMDKNGNNIWARDANVNAETNAMGIALRNSDEVMIAGHYPGWILWPGSGDTVRAHVPNEAYDVFIARFSTGDGSVKGMDWIPSTFGVNEFTTCIANDDMGNVYIGGDFAGDMKVNALNYLVSTGGRTDWFVVKYGDMWPTNVNQFISEKEVVIYPNSAQGYINISHAGIGTTLKLSDMAGRSLYTQTLSSDFERIDLTNYPSGNYIIQLTDKNGGRITKKFVKQ